MNKAKQQLQALRNYLGKDRQGLDLLGKVTSTLNEQRKEIASLKEQLQASQRAASELKDAAEPVKAKAEQLKQELVHVNAKLQSAEASKRILQGKVSEQARDQEPVDQVYNEEQIAQLVLKVAKVLKTAYEPPLVLGDEGVRKIPTVLLATIIRHYDSANLERLGRFVFLTAMMDSPVGVVSTEPIINSDAWTHERSVEFFRALPWLEQPPEWATEWEKKVLGRMAEKGVRPFTLQVKSNQGG